VRLFERLVVRVRARPLHRYGLGATAALVAALIRLALDPVLAFKVPFISFYPAVMLAAWVGGAPAGLLCTALSGLVAASLWLPPLWSVAVHDTGDLVALLVFLFNASVISVVAEALIRSRRRAEEATAAVGRELAERSRIETERRRAEERFRRLATRAPVGIFETDSRGDCLFVNERWCELAGLSPNEAVGQGWVRALHPDDRERVFAEWYDAARTNQEFESEYRFQRPDGQTFWLSGSATPLRDAVGQVIGYIGSIADITARKQADRERAVLLDREQAARQAAEEASRLKDEFLSTVSHELRTPLNAILGWTQVVGSGKRDEATILRAAGAIGRNAKAQAALIDDLLDVSRIITGRLRLEFQQVNLAQVVGAAIEAIAPAAEAKNVAIETALDPDAGPVSGDPARLQQVVWNLVSNAVKFTPGGGRVTVTVERVDQNAEIRVIDTGEGIGPQFLPHVFDRFRQADSSTTRPHGGLGLGLAIVRYLVELHGGTVHAASPGLGQGATFIVSLPHREETRRPYRPAVQGVAQTPPVAAALLGLRVLVVDDEEDARDVISTALDHRGAEVTAVPSVAAALDTLQWSAADVLVADIAMPGEDGYALIQRVRALEATSGYHVPAVALTARARPEDQDLALAAGFDRYLSKPVDVEELAATVAALAERRH
jgi:PAS domain S-box-containing protein